MKTLHEALVDTRNRIEGNWLGGIIGDGVSKKVCLVGGFYLAIIDQDADVLSVGTHNAVYALSRSVYRDELYSLAKQFLPEHHMVSAGRTLDCLFVFNDESTEKGVLEFLDKCIQATAPEPEDLVLEEPKVEEVLVEA